MEMVSVCFLCDDYVEYVSIHLTTKHEGAVLSLFPSPFPSSYDYSSIHQLDNDVPSIWIENSLWSFELLRTEEAEEVEEATIAAEVQRKEQEINKPPPFAVLTADDVLSCFDEIEKLAAEMDSDTPSSSSPITPLSPDPVESVLSPNNSSFEEHWRKCSELLGIPFESPALIEMDDAVESTSSSVAPNCTVDRPTVADPSTSSEVEERRTSYACRVCRKEAINKRAHIYWHLNEADMFYCRLCDFKSTWLKGNVVQHATRVHGDTSAVVSREAEFVGEFSRWQQMCYGDQSSRSRGRSSGRRRGCGRRRRRSPSSSPECAPKRLKVSAGESHQEKDELFKSIFSFDDFVVPPLCEKNGL